MENVLMVILMGQPTTLTPAISADCTEMLLNRVTLVI